MNTANTIYLGDCLNILPTLSPKSVDLVICDLPYGEINEFCKWDIPIDMNKFWKQMKRVLRTPNSPVVLWGSVKFFTNILYPSNPKWFRYEIPVFKKNHSNPFLSKLRPRCDMEYMFVFSQKKANYLFEQFHTITQIQIQNNLNNIWKNKGRVNTYEPRLPSYSNIIKQPLNNIRYKNTHPTKKCPKCQYDLAKYLVKEGGTILDPCMGVGTTLETAKMLKCNFIGIEKEPKYFYNVVQSVSN